MTRIRKACDMCRARKVKCDAAQPCRSCRDLGVDCTFQYISRRRGPTSKYAGMSAAPDAGLVAAASTTRDKLPPPVSLPASSPSHPPSFSSLASLPSPWPTDAIAPMPVLALLVDDYFTYIYPLVPFPHEPTFRRRFGNEAERRRPDFVALVAAMVSSLAACFPRSAQGQSLPQTDSGMTLKKRAAHVVACCRDVALTARGTQLYSRRRLTTDDAATSYLLGLAAGYTFDWEICRRFMAETMTFIQELLGPDLRIAANAVEDQMARRIYWIVFLAVRSIVQEGTALGELPMPMLLHAMKQMRPPLPDEIDDVLLTPEGVVEAGGTTKSVSLITGFNRVVRVYLTMDRVLTAELLGAEKALPAERAALLLESLQDAKTLADELPDELYLPLPGSTRTTAPTAAATPTTTADGDTAMEGGEVPAAAPTVPDMVAPPPPLYDNFYDDVPGYQYYPPGVEGSYVYRTPPGSSTDEHPDQSDDLRVLLDQEPQRRRQVQYDIQKTNIYASLLATRSYYVERYSQLVQAGSVADESRAVAVERDLIVRSLLLVLAIIPQCNMEPNGTALISKIRQVASTLLGTEGAVKTGASAQLGRFLEILVRLERLEHAGGEGRRHHAERESHGHRHGDAGSAGSAGSVTGSTGAASVDLRLEDDSEELQGWASLREEQLRFVASEGFLSSQSGGEQWNWR